MKKIFFFILSILLAVSITAVAQENIPQTPSEFPVGSVVGLNPSPGVLAAYDSSGMNWIIKYADGDSKDFLQKYNVIPFNNDTTDWIHYYSTGYYSKWESEENQTNSLKIGVKHISGNDTIGRFAIWKDSLCWSSLDLTEPRDSLIYGPHYFQAKKYRRPLGKVTSFIARFNMAIGYNQQPGESE